MKFRNLNRFIISKSPGPWLDEANILQINNIKYGMKDQSFFEDLRLIEYYHNDVKVCAMSRRKNKIIIYDTLVYDKRFTKQSEDDFMEMCIDCINGAYVVTQIHLYRLNKKPSGDGYLFTYYVSNNLITDIKRTNAGNGDLPECEAEYNYKCWYDYTNKKYEYQLV